MTFHRIKWNVHLVTEFWCFELYMLLIEYLNFLFVSKLLKQRKAHIDFIISSWAYAMQSTKEQRTAQNVYIFLEHAWHSCHVYFTLLFYENLPFSNKFEKRLRFSVDRIFTWLTTFTAKFTQLNVT